MGALLMSGFVSLIAIVGGIHVDAPLSLRTAQRSALSDKKFSDVLRERLLQNLLGTFKVFLEYEDIHLEST